MKRLFGAHAYGDAPRAGCWWDDTCKIMDRPALTNDREVDVAIIGAGFTGLSAALHLAQAGVRVVVLDAQRIGWGASGRNGGFCCLGGGMAGDALLNHRFGRAGRVEYRRTERAAVDLVEGLIAANALDVDRHSQGETCLAHRAKDMTALREEAATISENYDVGHQLHGAGDLAASGMQGPFHGGLTIEAGFALNPRKYLAGLARAAETAGAQIFERSAAHGLSRSRGGWRLGANGHTLRAEHVVIATNGYSSEDMPDWLAGRYLPGQSNVMVTRPLTQQELETAGWTTDQMAYDTRNLLHYFRLMPDRRFLFGMRGGLRSGPAADARGARRIRADFDAMFPAWRGVEAAHHWSGMVCVARDMLPFVGGVPEQPGLWAGLCYHGNGVAMGSYSGALLADLVQGQAPQRLYPDALRAPLRRFGLGRWRRAAMPLAYGALMLADR